MTKHSKAKDLEALASAGATDDSAAKLSVAITTPTNPNSVSLPELVIDQADYPAAARDLAVRLATVESIYRRDTELIKISCVNGAWSATALEPNHIIVEAHKLCKPVELKFVGGEQRLVPTSLKSSIARLMLAMPDEWTMRPFSGFCASPILGADGAMRYVAGYDPETGFVCKAQGVPSVPATPNREDALVALSTLRGAFSTFPFADRVCVPGSDFTDISRPPGRDESAFMSAILTAVCRSSLPLCPGILIRAPAFSGAGTGKGLLARAAWLIATGATATAFTAGDRAELDKRVASALLSGDSLVFVDNMNGTALRSDLLAQVITERSVAVRPLRRSEMVKLPSNAFVAVTGNGLDVSEDLARRFLLIELDARVESPEQRSFATGFLEEIGKRRTDLLTAAITIWRWGRQNQLERGRPLGSFEDWSDWVRDPLLALGCLDPVERLDMIKANDPERAAIVEFLSAWRQVYGDKSIRIRDLRSDVLAALPARARSRQAFARFVNELTQTRIGNYLVVRQAHGKWGASEYRVLDGDGTASK